MSTAITLLKQLFPSKCLLCCTSLINTEQYCCSACNDYLPHITLACGKCSTTLTTTQELCGFCLSTQRHWEMCISPFIYKDPLPELIHRFKYQHNTIALNFFTKFILQAVKDSDTEMPNFLTYVPSHPKRFIERGYNQSLLLTQSLSKATNIPYISAFDKVIFSQQQTSLNKKGRNIAPKNTFQIKNAVKEIIQQKHIAIIDDVVTTGSTSTELAKILKSADANRVDVWCIART